MRELLSKKRQVLTKTRRFDLKKIFLWAGLLFIVVAFAFALFVLSIISDVPEFPTKIVNEKSTIIYDREGNVLYTIHGEENRFEIPLDQIPQHVIDATVAIEDDRFFEHRGFDIGGIIKGFLAEYLRIGKRRGGSTITQQLVKNTLLSSERTVTRKVKEIILSLQMERTFSKNEILSMYLNTIPYGSNAYGIEIASRVYFNKHAPDLTLAEAAILASLPQAPSRYNPYGNGKNQLMGYFDEEGNYHSGRKDTVLKRMEDLGLITDEQRKQAFEQALQITFQRAKDNIKHPHFVLFIKELLENKFGKEAVEKGGLQVYTTLDPNLQTKAEEVIVERIKTYPEKFGASNAGLLTVDLEKGQILAMVGSSDYFNEAIDGNVNMVFRLRQPGSSFKPMVYATGFAKGYSPASVLFDVETDFGNKYIPQNYDGKFHGMISARKALANSLNVPAIKMAFLAGVDNVIEQAKRMGLTDLLDSEQYGVSIGIGTGEATLYQMVTAFSVFAKGGKKIEFTPFIRIENSEGKVIESYEENDPLGTEVLDPQIAYSINHVLSDKNARAPFWNAALVLPDQIAAAKTGTSNKRLKSGKEVGAIKPLDNWAIGYTTKYVTGVWIGNNDASPLNVGSDGISTAAPIWKAVMMEATKKDDLQEFPKPAGVSWKSVSKWSGLLASKHTPESDIVSELFTTYNTPSETDQAFLNVQIDRVSKKLPTPETPKEAITEALVANFHSENPTNPDWEKPVAVWVKEFLETNSLNKIVVEKIPTDPDDIHTLETRTKGPSISIVSPAENAVLPAENVDITVSITAPHGVEKVDYFLNDRFLRSSESFPYTEKLRIPKKSGDKPLTITAKVYDRLYYTAQSSIKVFSGNTVDSAPPEITLLYPQDGALFPVNTLLTIRTDSRDNIGVSEVSFFFDDREIGKSRKPPYELTYKIPDEVAPHTLRVVAKDSAGNSSKDSTEIRVEEKKSDLKTAFLFPQDGSTYKKHSPIDFFLSLSEEDQKNLASFQVKALNTGNNISVKLYENSKEIVPTSSYSFSWIPDLEGTYSCEIELESTDGVRKKVGALTLVVQ